MNIIASEADKAFDDAKDAYHAAGAAFVATIEPLIIERVRQCYPDAVSFMCKFDLTEEWQIVPDYMQVTLADGSEMSNVNDETNRLWGEVCGPIEYWIDVDGMDRDDIIEIEIG